MHILALDTTTREGSIAITRDGALVVERSGNPAVTHGQRLPGDIVAALDAARLHVDDLDLLAVAAGPGSFTGLRVGISTVQGLAVARGIKVVPVPTLEALARTVDTRSSNGLVAAWMDGQRGEVFAVLYDDTGRELLAPVAGRPERVLETWRDAVERPIVFVGDGAVRYRAIIEAHLPASTRVVQSGALAGTIARVAFEEPHRAVAPHEIVPLYVRRPDAELARERRLGVKGEDGAAPVKHRELG